RTSRPRRSVRANVSEAPDIAALIVFRSQSRSVSSGSSTSSSRAACVMPMRTSTKNDSSVDAEVGAEHLAWCQLDGDPFGHGPEAGRGLAVGLDRGDRAAVIAPLAQCGHEGQLREQRDVELVGELLPAARAEQLVTLAVVSGEPGHVLD